MNAFNTTTRDIANALLGKKRAAQEVVICGKSFSASGMRYQVRVAGEFYTVREGALRCLQDGMTPSELELEADEPEEEAPLTAEDHAEARADYQRRLRIEGAA